MMWLFVIRQSLRPATSGATGLVVVSSQLPSPTTPRAFIVLQANQSSTSKTAKLTCLEGILGIRLLLAGSESSKVPEYTAEVPESVSMALEERISFSECVFGKRLFMPDNIPCNLLGQNLVISAKDLERSAEFIARTSLGIG